MLYFRVITKANEELVHIYYSALNFRNVMLATGKLSLNVVVSDRLNQVRKETFVYSLISNNKYEQYWSFPALLLILVLLILIT
jgi:hypothetical protein